MAYQPSEQGFSHRHTPPVLTRPAARWVIRLPFGYHAAPLLIERHADGASVATVPVSAATPATLSATPREGERRCALCGCVLAADDVYASACSPCRSARASRCYLPQHDGQLRARLLAVLLEHKGERINVYRALGLWPCGFSEWTTVKVHVRYLRRHGHVVFGYHDGTYLYLSGDAVGPGSRRTDPSH